MANNLGLKLKNALKYIADHDLLLSILVTAVVVMVGIGIGYENNKIVPINLDPVAHYSLTTHNHLSFMVEWDGINYISLAKHGYASNIQANFFPLYPLLIRIVNSFVSSAVYSSLAISWVCLVGAVYFYLKIIKQIFNIKQNSEALRAVLFFVLYQLVYF